MQQTNLVTIHGMSSLFIKKCSIHYNKISSNKIYFFKSLIFNVFMNLIWDATVYKFQYNISNPMDIISYRMCISTNIFIRFKYVLKNRGFWILQIACFISATSRTIFSGCGEICVLLEPALQTSGYIAL